MKYFKRLNQALVLIISITLSNCLWADSPVATMHIGNNHIDWQPNENSTILLEITNGLQFSYRKVFKDNNPSFSIAQEDNNLTDGQYTYQLTAYVADGTSVRQSGSFDFVDGYIKTPKAEK